MAIFRLKSQFYLKLLILGAILFILVLATKEKNESFFQHICSPPQGSIFLDSGKKNRVEPPKFIISDKTFLYPNLPALIILPKVYAQIVSAEPPNNEILTHEVKEGETLWSITKEYNLKPETIIFANNLREETLKVGQELIILPVDGVLHIVQEGENLFEIVEKYKADLENTLVFNEITSPEEIFVGQVLIIPGAQPSKPLPPKKETPTIFAQNFSSSNYPYGYCTWWVAQKRSVPGWGNAKDWLKNAQAFGYEVCLGSNCQPRIGAIVSLRTRHPLGHVAYVEEVKDGKIIFSEMNYAGFGVITKRVLKIGDPRILGYIY